jgi:hypothetical protein
VVVLPGLSRLEIEAAQRRDAHELRGAVEMRGRVGENVLAFADQELLARKDRKPALELLGISAAGDAARVAANRASAPGRRALKISRLDANFGGAFAKRPAGVAC